MSTQGMTNNNSGRQLKDHLHSEKPKEILQPGTLDSPSRVHEMDSPSRESLEGRLLRFSLCFLHLWDVDCELDKLLVDEMQVCKPEGCHIATGVVGDRGSFTLMFPGKEATLEVNFCGQIPFHVKAHVKSDYVVFACFSFGSLQLNFVP
jgi:hypothetical protein